MKVTNACTILIGILERVPYNGACSNSPQMSLPCFIINTLLSNCICSILDLLVSSSNRLLLWKVIRGILDKIIHVVWVRSPSLLFKLKLVFFLSDLSTNSFRLGTTVSLLMYCSSSWFGKCLTEFSSMVGCVWGARVREDQKKIAGVGVETQEG